MYDPPHEIKILQKKKNVAKKLSNLKSRRLVERGSAEERVRCRSRQPIIAVLLPMISCHALRVAVTVVAPPFPFPLAYYGVRTRVHFIFVCHGVYKVPQNLIIITKKICHNKTFHACLLLFTFFFFCLFTFCYHAQQPRPPLPFFRSVQLIFPRRKHKGRNAT